MNDDRRQQILEAMRAVGAASIAIATASSLVEQARDEEQEYLDAMPEGLKGSERGLAAEAAIAEMDDALGELQQIGTDACIKSLEAAADISEPVETVEQKITSEEAKRRRLARLPDWAKQEIERLKAKVEAADARAAQAFPDATGAPNEIVLLDYLEGPFAGKRLPLDRISFPAHGIVIEADAEGVEVRSDGFNDRLKILPRTCNQAIVKAEPFS